jgi:RNA polymerase-associated protein
MPGDPVDRARVRLFLLNFEKELFVHVSTLESRAAKSNEKALEKARSHIRDRLTQLAPVFLKNKFMLGDNFSMLDVAIAVNATVVSLSCFNMFVSSLFNWSTVAV